MKKIKFITQIIAKLNGNLTYQEYLEHFYQKHPHQTPLKKQEFFAQKEDKKWNKINRCC